MASSDALGAQSGDAGGQEDLEMQPATLQRAGKHAMPNDESLRLNDREIGGMFSHPVDAERYPPLMKIDEAATP